MSERLALVVGCIVMLTAVGVILRLLLDDMGKKDACPYCSAPAGPGARFARSATGSLARDSTG